MNIEGFTVSASASFEECAEQVLGDAWNLDSFTNEGIYSLGVVYDYASSSWHTADKWMPAEYSYTAWRVAPIRSPYQYAYVWYERFGHLYYGEWVPVTQPDTFGCFTGF